MNLLEKCSRLREISYLKSFKIQEDDDDDEEETEDTNNEESNESAAATDDTNDSVESEESEEDLTTRPLLQRKCRSYYRYIKYAIENVNPRVNMKPCYGFDITPTSGHFLDFSNRDFIETTLPPIRPPLNDFHTRLFR